MSRFLPRILLLTLLVATPAIAQSPAPVSALTPAEREAVIDGVLDRIVAHYVFPDVGKKMAAAV